MAILPPVSYLDNGLAAGKIRAAARAAGESRATQNRLARTFEHYFRKRRQSTRGASVFFLQRFTFSDGEREFTFTASDAKWVMSRGGAGRGSHGLGAHERVRLPIAYRTLHRALATLRSRLRQDPLPGGTNGEANRQLPAVIEELPALLRDLRVTRAGGENVIGLRTGSTVRVLSWPHEPDQALVTWADFRRGSFTPSQLAAAVTAHIFGVSISTVEKVRAQQRRRLRSHKSELQEISI